jgi:hypothetical protein
MIIVVKQGAELQTVALKLYKYVFGSGDSSA